MSATAITHLPGGPDLRLLDTCVGCGLCLPACPTYQVLGHEMDSPRGRIDFVRAVSEGVIPLTPGVVSHLDRCLDCRACESACPSGVRYGQIIEETRAAIGPGREGGSRIARAVQSLALRRLLPSRGLLRATARALAIYQSTGIHDAIRRALPGRLRWAADLMPSVPGRPFRPPARRIAPRGRPRARVALFRGCVQDVLFPEVQRATVAALTAAGAEVIVPEDQTCCGALLLHTGERGAASRLLAQNARAFDAAGADAVVVNAAGCGSALADAGHVLEGAAGERLAARVRDVTEVLAELLPFPEPLRPLTGGFVGSLPPGLARVAYQDPCHLGHARRVKAPPRRVLEAIPGVDLVTVPDADTCCGSAGIYNLMQPEISRELTERKTEAVLATGASILATGNPGCMLQIRAGLRAVGAERKVRVVHPVELVAAAVGASA